MLRSQTHAKNTDGSNIVNRVEKEIVNAMQATNYTHFSMRFYYACSFPEQSPLEIHRLIFAVSAIIRHLPVQLYV
jgi:hypothetical protein